MKTIAIINQKGGIGKTTTTAALAAGLTQRGYKTLTVDLDPQRNFTLTTTADPEAANIENVLNGSAALEVVQKTNHGDIIAGSPTLAAADKKYSDIGKEFILKEAIAPAAKQYDYCIIDTPPALGVLTINALTAADFAIIPAAAEVYSLQGIKQLASTLDAVTKYTNPGLKVAGILLTKYSGRTALGRELKEILERNAAALHTKVFKTSIRETVAIGEAQANRKDIFTYAPRATATRDYDSFINELLEVIK